MLSYKNCVHSTMFLLLIVQKGYNEHEAFSRNNIHTKALVEKIFSNVIYIPAHYIVSQTSPIFTSFAYFIKDYIFYYSFCAFFTTLKAHLFSRDSLHCHKSDTYVQTPAFIFFPLKIALLCDFTF